MFKFVLFASLLVSVALAAPVEDQAELEARQEAERKQNYEAQYGFNNNVNDDINGAKIEREEKRSEGKVSGHYSYNDGFVMRTVYYEADENGYRVVKEDTQDVGDGPVYNPDGIADVEGSLIGKYSIKLDKNNEEKHYTDVKP